MGIFGKFRKENQSPKAPVQDNAPEQQPDNSSKTESLRISDLDYHPKTGYKCVSCGLIPVEILMISYCSNYVKDQNEFPGFWTSNYYIVEPKEVLNSLEKRQFILLCSNYESLASLKNDQLKEILRTKSLPLGGAKTELIDRIKSDFTEDQLESFVIPHYKPSESGRKAVEENIYIPFLHKESKDVRITPLSVNKQLKGEPCGDFEQLDQVLLTMENGCQSEIDRSQFRVQRQMLRARAYGTEYADSDKFMNLIYDTHLQTARNYLRAGYTHVVWVCTNDDKCCPLCRSMSEKSIDIRNEHPTLPPAHQGCRCTIVIDLDKRPRVK